MPESLRGKEVLLAGGSGGLGAPVAQMLAAEGARLLVSYRHNQERASLLAGVAHVSRADLRKGEDRQQLLDALPELYGVVVFSGMPARPSPGTDPAELLRESMDVNCIGPLLLAREAAERMRRNATAGSIVLFSTMQAVLPFAQSTAYAVPKAALLHGMRILALECRGINLRVNAIAPGVMQAGMANASIASGKYHHYLDQKVIPRYGTAGDVSRTVRFLLEPDNYVTGQVLTVDGGLTL